MNQVILMGRMAREPELKHTKNGTPVLAFAIAVDRPAKEGVDFIDCVAWRERAEFISKYFEKGQMIAIVGRLQVREYTDKDGIKRKEKEVIVEKNYFTAGKAKTSNTPVKAEDFEELDESAGDLPF